MRKFVIRFLILPVFLLMFSGTPIAKTSTRTKMIKKIKVNDLNTDKLLDKVQQLNEVYSVNTGE